VKYTLPKIEKLKKEIQIKTVFASGNKTIKFPVRANWSVLDHNDSAQVKLLVGCPKKNIKLAVHRNKIKRLLREAYRLNKFPLISLCNKKNIKIGLCIIYIGNEIPNFEYIMQKVETLLSQVMNQIEENTHEEQDN
jgi:ribonuclease P protein component